MVMQNCVSILLWGKHPHIYFSLFLMKTEINNVLEMIETNWLQSYSPKYLPETTAFTNQYPQAQVAISLGFKEWEQRNVLFLAEEHKCSTKTAFIRLAGTTTAISYSVPLCLNNRTTKIESWLFEGCISSHTKTQCQQQQITEDTGNLFCTEMFVLSLHAFCFPCAPYYYLFCFRK